MKSAKDWVEYLNSQGADITDVEIKEIQLDAYKEGLKYFACGEEEQIYADEVTELP